MQRVLLGLGLIFLASCTPPKGSRDRLVKTGNSFAADFDEDSVSVPEDYTVKAEVIESQTNILHLPRLISNGETWLPRTLSTRDLLIDWSGDHKRVFVRGSAQWNNPTTKSSGDIPFVLAGNWNSETGIANLVAVKSETKEQDSNAELRGRIFCIETDSSGLCSSSVVELFVRINGVIFSGQVEKLSSIPQAINPTEDLSDAAQEGSNDELEGFDLDLEVVGSNEVDLSNLYEQPEINQENDPIVELRVLPSQNRNSNLENKLPKPKIEDEGLKEPFLDFSEVPSKGTEDQKGLLQLDNRLNTIKTKTQSVSNSEVPPYKNNTLKIDQEPKLTSDDLSIIFPLTGKVKAPVFPIPIATKDLIPSEPEAPILEPNVSSPLIYNRTSQENDNALKKELQPNLKKSSILAPVISNIAGNRTEKKPELNTLKPSVSVKDKQKISSSSKPVAETVLPNVKVTVPIISVPIKSSETKIVGDLNGKGKKQENLVASKNNVGKKENKIVSVPLDKKSEKQKLKPTPPIKPPANVEINDEPIDDVNVSQAPAKINPDQPAAETNVSMEIGGALKFSDQSRGAHSKGSLRKGTNLKAVVDKMSGRSHILVIHPNQKRYYGNFAAIELLVKASVLLARIETDKYLEVGDISDENGGRLRPHKSHQNGLDMDIRFFFNELTNLAASKSALAGKGLVASFARSLHWKFFKALMTYYHDKIYFILLHPSVKQAMCTEAIKSGDLVKGKAIDPIVMHTLRRLVPERSHYNHFHLRMKCPVKDKLCVQTTRDIPMTMGCFGKNKN